MKKFIAILLLMLGCVSYPISIPTTPYQDISDKTIIVVTSDKYGLAGATYSHGTPVIYFNPFKFKNYEPDIQYFIYLHEVGHLKLGHVYLALEPRFMEYQADCWAIKHLQENYQFNNRRIENILVFIEKELRSGPRHKPGKERVRDLKNNCLGE